MRSNPVPGILIPDVHFLADKGKNSPIDYDKDDDGGGRSIGIRPLCGYCIVVRRAHKGIVIPLDDHSDGSTGSRPPSVHAKVC
jgi:hypothetical protein